MANLPAIYFKHLPLTGHYAFLTERFTPALDAAGEAVKQAVQALRPELDEWLAKERQLLEWQRRSTFTQQIAAADDVLDHSLSALGAHIKVALYSDDADIVAAGERLNLMLKSFGKFTNAPYESEVGAVKTILGRLQGDMAADVQRLNLGAQVGKIQAAFDSFNALFNARHAETAQKPNFNSHTVRKGVESVYHQMAAIINANSLLGASPDFDAFISAIAPAVDYMNTQYKPAAKKAETPAAQ